MVGSNFETEVGVSWVLKQKVHALRKHRGGSQGCGVNTVQCPPRQPHVFLLPATLHKTNLLYPSGMVAPSHPTGPVHGCLCL